MSRFCSVGPYILNVVLVYVFTFLQNYLFLKGESKLALMGITS